jgi:hypothetical protein
MIKEIIERQKMDVLLRGAGEKYVHKIINGQAKRSGFLERKATNFGKKEVVKVQKEKRLWDEG